MENRVLTALWERGQPDWPMFQAVRYLAPRGPTHPIYGSPPLPPRSTISGVFQLTFSCATMLSLIASHRLQCLSSEGILGSCVRSPDVYLRGYIRPPPRTVGLEP